MKKAGFVVTALLVGLSVLGVSVHAASGPGPHEPMTCVLCGLCSLINQMVN